jgi:hypothetical protein
MSMTRRAAIGLMGLMATIRGPRAGAMPSAGVMPSGPPHPTLVRRAYFRLPGGWVTAIMRHWAPGDSGPGGRCKLCPECHAGEDGCMVMVGRWIEKDDAPLYSMNGKVIQPVPTGPNDRPKTIWEL